jgi:hypothetical protein
MIRIISARNPHSRPFVRIWYALLEIHHTWMRMSILVKQISGGYDNGHIWIIYKKCRLSKVLKENYLIQLAKTEIPRQIVAWFCYNTCWGKGPEYAVAASQSADQYLNRPRRWLFQASTVYGGPVHRWFRRINHWSHAESNGIHVSRAISQDIRNHWYQLSTCTHSEPNLLRWEIF